MSVYQFEVQQEDAGDRLDQYVSTQFPDISRSRVADLIEAAFVRVNNSSKSKSYKLRENDVIQVEVPEAQPLAVCAENIPLEIVYEDCDLLVVNKPQGMVVHPAPGSPNGTLVNALLYHCGDSLSGINGVLRPGIVHRIDRNTSGLLIVAKTDRSHRGLAEQIAEHSFTREYQGICYGTFVPGDGCVNRPIGRSKTDRKKMAIDEAGRNAVTHYRTSSVVSWKEQSYSHMFFRLETGRTHQIRVHMASLGHPLIGDPVYGREKSDAKLFPELVGQCLHAYHIGFVHPVTGESLSFNSELPDYFKNTLKKINS